MPFRAVVFMQTLLNVQSHPDSTLVEGANCTHVALTIAGEIYRGIVIPLMGFVQNRRSAQ